MATKNWVKIQEDIMDDKAKLLTEARNELGKNFDESQIDVEEGWTPYNIRPFEGHTKERVIIFRPKPPVAFVGCIRVRKEPSKEVLWEVTRKNGVYMGYVPVGYSFEAMSVEVKFLTRK